MLGIGTGKIRVKISVILATKNEAANVERCILSLLEQNYPKNSIEIILVDNGSTDDTVELAKKHIDKVYSLKDHISLESVRNFRGAQVNFGAEKVSGDVVFFPDADMTFDTELFNDVSQRLKTSDALFVPEIVLGKGLFGKIRNFERSFYDQTCIDGVRFVKRDLFQEIGGFDVTHIVFGPDDWDLTKSLKAKGAVFGITDKPLFHHESWLSLKVYLSKKKKYLKTFEGYVQKWGNDDPDVQKQFGLYYRYLGVFFENGKWKKAVSNPFLFLGTICLRCLVGSIYILNKIAGKAQ